MWPFKKTVTVKVTPGPQDAERRLWLAMRNDKEYCRLMAENGRLHEEVEADYSVISTMGIQSGPQLEAFIKKCNRALDAVERLTPLWVKYRQELPTLCAPAKRLAMVYEKCGDYDHAAAVCLRAIKNGWTDDGTSGAMRGRLARLVKKGGLPVTPEIQDALAIK